RAARARHQVALRIGRMPHADMAEGVENALIGDDAVGAGQLHFCLSKDVIRHRTLLFFVSVTFPGDRAHGRGGPLAVGGAASQRDKIVIIRKFLQVELGRAYHLAPPPAEEASMAFASVTFPVILAGLGIALKYAARRHPEFRARLKERNLVAQILARNEEVG